MYKYTTLSLLLLLLGTAGCTTKPSRFYVLEPETTAKPRAEYPRLILGVGPVRIAAYLERPQIVSRIGAGQLVVEEFERWGGTLEANVTRVTAENLSHRLGTGAVVTFPWERVVIPRFQISIDVRRFDPTGNSQVYLVAQWRIAGQDSRRLLAIETSTITEEIDGAGLGPLVSAQNRALARLSDEISMKIHTLMAEN